MQGIATTRNGGIRVVVLHRLHSSSLTRSCVSITPQNRLSLVIEHKCVFVIIKSNSHHRGSCCGGDPPWLPRTSRHHTCSVVAETTRVVRHTSRHSTLDLCTYSSGLLTIHIASHSKIVSSRRPHDSALALSTNKRRIQVKVDSP